MRSKKEWMNIGYRREGRFRRIAEALGDKHPITKMMGTLVWGRHSWEPGLSEPKEALIVKAAALDACFSILNTWALHHDPTAQRIILNIWHDR